MTKPQLLIATHNPGKVREYRELLRGLDLPLVSLSDVGIAREVAETGETFAENAWLKARAYAALSGLLTLSDDSGLEVDALGGAPGIHSARYGGDACPDDAARVNLLLSNLQGIPWAQRTARFRCVIALQHPQGAEVSVAGAVAGMIQYTPQGKDGFGYDPVFYLPSLRRTMAQLPLDEKNRISHRANAAGRAVPALRRLLAAAPGCNS